MIREWLGAMLRGDAPPWGFSDGMAHEDITDAANAEGVLSLLHERISIADAACCIPLQFQEHIAHLARKKSQQSLMREAECRRILSRLKEAGIDVLLLKGSALAYWLYPSAHLRDCSDIDLLFSSYEQVQKAIALLQSMQYSLRDNALAGDLVSFEQTCIRDSTVGAGLEIDLHWKLSSSPLFAYQFNFDELNFNAIALPKLGEHARGLSPIHAFLNACMHRVQNMADGTENVLKWLYDLHLLSSQFAPADWQALSDLAIERKLAGICWDGLQAVSGEFNTPTPDAILDTLLNAAKHEHMQVPKMHGWFYIQRMSFIAFPTIPLRIRWLRQRCLPNMAYLQTRYSGKNMAELLFRRIKAGLQRLF